MIENRFVAHGDILGFRKMVLDGDLETVCDRLDKWAAEASPTSLTVSREIGVAGEIPQ
jgi:hypothetical protein